MTIRTKLFIFIPLIVILMNVVSYFIFDSSKKVQESYNLMMDRILLYKQISHETQESLRYFSHFFLRLDQDSFLEFNKHTKELERLRFRLLAQKKTELNHVQIRNYANLIETFLEQVQGTTATMNKEGINNNTHLYMEAEKTSRFIAEHGQALVDLELSYYQPIYQEIIHATDRMNLLGALLFITSTLLSITFAIWLSRSITAPIRRLVATAKQIAKGNLDTKAPELGSTDEIGILCRTFNRMLENVKDLMEKNLEGIEKDRMVKEFELKALQSQINPHFLFNTLNVISKLAYIEGAEKTSDLTISVSRLIRYNLRKLDQAVTLRDEVEHAKEYFSIQKARFRDRVSFELDIDDRALEQAVPCLTLQPILENAFMHGIEEKEEGAVLKLTVHYVDSHVRVEVADNGVGMTEETRKKLLQLNAEGPSGQRSGHSTGLGTHNVFKRLDHFFEGKQTIEVLSGINEGTSVIFRLPNRSYQP
ncbi:sensor histidine kinase [Ammoniphilus sp. YIM 78166]|uniref:sensor histidine kinase n=1 Tax=Ammoniphilus sp. YIM 78166 TaxID=1644106 RepID=UPI0010703456|nr:sensor histidine kinase [Ammoniphilus sp. YIM 78166]